MKRTTSKDQNHHVLLRMHENEEAMVTVVTSCHVMRGHLLYVASRISVFVDRRVFLATKTLMREKITERSRVQFPPSRQSSRGPWCTGDVWAINVVFLSAVVLRCLIKCLSQNIQRGKPLLGVRAGSSRENPRFFLDELLVYYSLSAACVRFF